MIVDGQTSNEQPKGLKDYCYGLVVVGLLLSLTTGALAQDDTNGKAKADPKAKVEAVKKEASAKASDTSKEAVSQEETSKAETPKEEAAKEAVEEPAKKKTKEQIAYEKKFGEWKELLSKIRSVRLKYRTLDTEEEQATTKQEYLDLLAQGRKLAPDVKAGALAYYEADPKADPQVEEFLAAEAQKEFNANHLTEAAKIAKLLADSGYMNATIFRLAGSALFDIGRVDESREYLQKAADNNALDPASKLLFDTFDEQAGYWEEELKYRGADNMANLPRVVLTTNKGDIEIELFEDQAPNTVANFIELVEKGFYKDIKFHRVLPEFMAQTGCPKGDGSGGPGYQIASECQGEDAKFRRHFRGSLSMTPSMSHFGAILPDSGGSKFSIVYHRAPVSDLDGKMTVFGRVVEGMDTVSDLQAINPRVPDSSTVPDQIKSAKVIRKRDHEYKVEKITDDKKEENEKKEVKKNE